MEKNEISVVIPIYNEEEAIKRISLNLIPVLKKAYSKYEIIIVESGSTDRTGKICDELAKKNKKIKIIHQKRKEGYGSGLRLGYKFAKYKYIGYTDGDIPYDLIEFVNVIPLIKTCDAVIGYKKGRRESFKRKFFSFCYNSLIRIIFGLKVKDINFSFKVIRKDVLEKLDLKSNGWFIDAEIQAELKRKKFKVKEMGIKYIHRKVGKSKVKINLKLILGILKELLNYIKRKKTK